MGIPPKAAPTLVLQSIVDRASNSASMGFASVKIRTEKTSDCFDLMEEQSNGDGVPCLEVPIPQKHGSPSPTKERNSWQL
jgi:hypothetical protein